MMQLSKMKMMYYLMMTMIYRQRLEVIAQRYSKVQIE